MRIFGELSDPTALIGGIVAATGAVVSLAGFVVREAARKDTRVDRVTAESTALLIQRAEKAEAELVEVKADSRKQIARAEAEAELMERERDEWQRRAIRAEQDLAVERATKGHG